MLYERGTAAPRRAWVPRCVPPQQMLSLHVKYAGPLFLKPPKKLRLPRIFLYFKITRLHPKSWMSRCFPLILPKARSDSPGAAPPQFLCVNLVKESSETDQSQSLILEPKLLRFFLRKSKILNFTHVNKLKLMLLYQRQILFERFLE